MLQKYRYHFLLHFIILLWGFTGILGKLIKLDSLHIVWYRLLIAVIGIGVYFYLLKRSIKVSSPIQLVKLVGVGIIIAMHWLTFFKAIQLSTASLGILCLSTTTLHVSWLEPIIMKRKFLWAELMMGVLVIGGIGIVSSGFTVNDYEALAYGLSSAIFAALFTVFNGYLVKEIPSSTMGFYELLAGFIFLSIYLLANHQINSSLFEMTGCDFLWLLFLGLLCTSFAFLSTIEITKELGAYTVALCINLEPVYTIVLAIIILKENKELSMQFYFGAIIIVMVLITNSILKHYFRKKQPAIISL